jgi:hypothetical protein
MKNTQSTESVTNILTTEGKGSYGVVVSAKTSDVIDSPNQHVAIKKIENVFEHSTFSIRCLREMKLNRLLQHDNVNRYINP